MGLISFLWETTKFAGRTVRGTYSAGRAVYSVAAPLAELAIDYKKAMDDKAKLLEVFTKIKQDEDSGLESVMEGLEALRRQGNEIVIEEAEDMICKDYGDFVEIRKKPGMRASGKNYILVPGESGVLEY